jgi:hypothetical protein
MAIQINGNGTITGISVGGLPDGIVDSDMLADGAVSPAKRGTDSVLQIVQNTNYTRVAISSSTFTETPNTATITPTKASSKILVTVTGDVNTEANNRSAYISVFRSVNSGTFTNIAPPGSNGTSNNGFTGEIRGSSSRLQVPFTINYLDSPSYSLGNSIVYKLYIRSGDGSAVEIPSNSSAQSIIFMVKEVSA